MPTFFNISNRKGVFMIPAGATKSPTPAPPSFSNTKSLSFDGVDEYVDVGNISDLNNTTEASWSMWVKRSGVSDYYIMSCYSATGSLQQYLFHQYSDRILVYLGNSAGALRFMNRSNYTFNVGEWYHIGIVYNEAEASNSDKVKVYINGVLQINQTTGFALTSLNSTTAITSIGRAVDFTTKEYNGNIDEVAIFNTALTSEQISTIATAPSDLSSYNPVAWYRMGDNSTYQTPQILMPENTNKDKVSNYSLTFDGVDDVINIANPTSFTDTGDFSISAWIKYTTTGAVHIFNIRDNRILYVSSGRIIGAFRNSGGGFVSITSPSLYNDNQWHHALFVKNSTNLILYVDGTQVAINSNGGATQSGGTSYARISARASSSTPTNIYGGFIDEVSFYESDQSANISSIYNSGTPTTISGATAYWKLGEQSKFTDNWLVPNSALSNYSNYSFNFDGVDDYISVTANPLTDFTVSFWINPSTSAGASYDGILGQGTTSPQGGILRYVAYDGTASVGNVLVFLGTWTIVAGLTNGEWSNVILTYDSTLDEFKSYKNGSLYTTISSPNFSGQTTNAHSFERIGLRNGLSGTEFNGAIDEVAVWDSALTDISSIYNGGEPTTIPSGAVAHWRMGEDATYNSSTSQWTIPDQVGSNDGTSSNTMALDTLVGEAPNYFGGGVSDAMTIEDRVGDAPNSENNAVSYNMEAEDIDNNTP